MRMLCFVDESVEQRSAVACMCGICLRGRDCGRRLLGEVERAAGWRRGEVKFRKLLRALGSGEAVARVIQQVLLDTCVAGYACVGERLPRGVLDGETRRRLLGRLLALLARHEPREVVLDEMPLSDHALAEARRSAGLPCKGEDEAEPPGARAPARRPTRRRQLPGPPLAPPRPRCARSLLPPGPGPHPLCTGVDA